MSDPDADVSDIGSPTCGCRIFSSTSQTLWHIFLCRWSTLTTDSIAWPRDRRPWCPWWSGCWWLVLAFPCWPTATSRAAATPRSASSSRPTKRHHGPSSSWWACTASWPWWSSSSRWPCCCSAPSGSPDSWSSDRWGTQTRYERQCECVLPSWQCLLFAFCPQQWRLSECGQFARIAHRTALPSIPSPSSILCLWGWTSWTLHWIHWSIFSLAPCSGGPSAVRCLLPCAVARQTTAWMHRPRLELNPPPSMSWSPSGQIEEAKTCRGFTNCLYMISTWMIPIFPDICAIQFLL